MFYIQIISYILHFSLSREEEKHPLCQNSSVVEYMNINCSPSTCSLKVQPFDYVTTFGLCILNRKGDVHHIYCKALSPALERTVFYYSTHGREEHEANVTAEDTRSSNAFSSI